MTAHISSQRKLSSAKVMHLLRSLPAPFCVHSEVKTLHPAFYSSPFLMSVTQLFNFISPCVFLLPCHLTENHQICLSLPNISHLHASAHTKYAFPLISPSLQVHSADVYSMNHFLIYLNKKTPPSLVYTHYLLYTTSLYILISVYHLVIIIFQLQFYFIFGLSTPQHKKD